MFSFLDQIFTTLMKMATTVVLLRKELSTATGTISCRMAIFNDLGVPSAYFTILYMVPVWTSPAMTTNNAPTRTTDEDENPASTSFTGKVPVTISTVMAPRKTKSAGSLVHSIKMNTSRTVIITIHAFKVNPKNNMLSIY